jgi:sulfane dehydrogenase subunit SoxC
VVVYGGAPDIDPDKHRLVIHGLVKRPLAFTLEALSRYPMVSRVTFLECGGNSALLFSPQPMQESVQMLHGLASCSEWTGVRLSTLLEETGIDPKAKWFIAEGADAPHVSRSVPLRKALDDAMIALYQNGERLMPANGYPMRLLLPGYEGNMNVKYLRRIKLVEEPAMSFYEAKTYAQILPNGKAYQFYFLQEVKSFITQPSPGLMLNEPGLYQISGIAYSGTGRISKVMVSADGGRSWSEALLQEPVLSKAFTRFRMPWRWDGGPAILQSRAWDEAGNVQPTRAQFVAQRGELKKVPTGPGLSEPTLQRRHELGGRRKGWGPACLRVRFSSRPFRRRSFFVRTRRLPKGPIWESRSIPRPSRHGISAFNPTAPACHRVAARPPKEPKSMRASAPSATARTARAGS